MSEGQKAVRPSVPGFVSVATALFLATPTAAEDRRIGAHGLALPASFSGVLPCADCPGIRHHLDVWPDGGYALQLTYIDRDTVIETMGRWHVDPTRSALVLTGAEPTEWQILPQNRLRLLDRDGNPIDSDLPYELDGGTLAPFDFSGPMSGEFVYFADAALFTECLTGVRFPVVMEGDYLALERAYLDQRDAGLPPQAPLLARVEGRLAEAEQMEGPPRRSLSVERLHHVTPHGACATARAPADLVNSYWRLTELDGADVPLEASGREPHLLLHDAEGPRFLATVGCNTLLGGFEHDDGTALSFGPAASTLMACPPEVAARETALGAALEATASFDSDGHILRLRDGDGTVRARFLAVYTAF